MGDYATPGPVCGCGRGLPVLERVMGRARNMLVLPDGRRLWPRLGINDYTAAAGVPVQQAQVQDVLAELRGERTVVLCTHDLQEARRLTSRVAVLQSGRLLVMASGGATPA